MTDQKIAFLLIEDDPDDTLLMVESLNRIMGSALKFSLECVSSLEAGLQGLSQGGVDVVLLDLMLPDSQGIETLIKARGQAPNIPIIVLTGLDNEAMALEALRQGAQDYLFKGNLDEHVLTRAISYAVERNRLLAQMEALIRSSADGLIVVDAGGTVRYVNPAAERLFGRRAREMTQRPFDHPVTPGRTMEIKIPAAGGDKIAEMLVTEIEWKGSHAALASVRDITSLKRAEQLKAEIKERRRIEDVKDQFVNAVSHEMRTPLTVIKTALYHVLQEGAGPLSPTQERFLGLASKNAERLVKVVDSLLDLARLESGKARLHRKKVSPSSLVLEAVENFTVLTMERGIVIEARVPEDLPFIAADEDLLRQLLANLMDNALRFARRRILVSVKVVERAASERQGEGGLAVADARRALQVSVEDDGPGLAAEDIPTLFNRFAQVKRPADKHGYKGTGLGLFISKEIVERHKGRIWVESAPAKGARFKFMLPLD